MKPEMIEAIKAWGALSAACSALADAISRFRRLFAELDRDAQVEIFRLVDREGDRLINLYGFYHTQSDIERAIEELKPFDVEEEEADEAVPPSAT